MGVFQLKRPHLFINTFKYYFILVTKATKIFIINNFTSSQDFG